MNQKYRSNEHKISTNEHKNFKITKKIVQIYLIIVKMNKNSLNEPKFSTTEQKNSSNEQKIVQMIWWKNI